MAFIIFANRDQKTEVMVATDSRLRIGLSLVGLLLATAVGAQFWYLDVMTGELKYFKEGGDRFAERGLLAVAKGNTRDLVAQLPHALDGYGIAYEHRGNDLVVYTAKVYKAWRLMKAGEDIQMTLSTLMLADLSSGIPAIQTRIIGSLYRSGFPRIGLQHPSQLWQLPAVKRGIEIEIIRAGSHRLPNGFPVVDILRNGTAISVKSIDFTLKSYKGSLLLYKLKGYVNKLARFRGATWGGRTVRGNVKKELEIVIPRGKATKAQQKIFDEVVEYGKMNHISVKIIEL